MPMIETKDMITSGQIKTGSFWKMFWETRFKGSRVATTLHVPRRNLLGQITISKLWILDPKPGKHS